MSLVIEALIYNLFTELKWLKQPITSSNIKDTRVKKNLKQHKSGNHTRNFVGLKKTTEHHPCMHTLISVSL